MAYNPITDDLQDDIEFPASSSGIVIEHQGAKLNGIMYHPAGEELRPLAILLHGFPGHERNFDLAQILRRAGWHTLVFHYRGSWGSGGDYRLKHVLEDVEYVVKHFRRAKRATDEGRIDPSRIVTIGHSIGGWASLWAAAHGIVDEAVSIAAVDVGHWARVLREDEAIARSMIQSVFADGLAPLAGVTADDLVEEVLNSDESWAIAALAPKLAEKRLLILAGKRDTLITPFDHHLPLTKALNTANAPNITHDMLKTNHSFDNSRIELARRISDWLS